MPRTSTRWLMREPSRGDRPLLFAFPFAGSGPSSLRRWPARVGEAELVPVTLPGHDYRIKEPAYADFATFAKEAVEALGPYLDRPYAVIGHCMGALLAHAFTAQSGTAGAPAPKRLFVSASLTPARGFYGYYHPWMSDTRIARELTRVATDLGDDPIPDELVALSIRVLRADVRMCLGHQPPVEPLGVPITAIGWAEDADVAPADLTEWREYGDTVEHVLPGDPLNFLAAPPGLLNVLADDLEC